jgi:DNA-binding MurR/RpiR family transcriptional regulator
VSNAFAMPPDAHTLAERLRRDYDNFSPAQQALARYLVDHLAELPLLSAHEVALAAHCSPATVVRFAQALGYAGYPELQRTVRTAQRPALPPRRASQLGLFAGGDGVEQLFAADHLALDDALSRLGRDGIAPLASALSGRSPLVLAGEGHARPVIALIEERVERSGRAVLVVEGLEPRHRARLGSLERTAGVLAVAIGRETAVADAALNAARTAGIPAVSLVDSSLSPAARAPVSLVVPADERGGAPGLVAFVAVAQALADTLAPAVAARTLSALAPASA